MSAVLPPDPLGIVTSILFERLVEFLDETEKPISDFERMSALNRPPRTVAVSAPDPRPGRTARPKRMHRVRL